MTCLAFRLAEAHLAMQLVVLRALRTIALGASNVFEILLHLPPPLYVPRFAGPVFVLVHITDVT